MQLAGEPGLGHLLAVDVMELAQRERTDLADYLRITTARSPSSAVWCLGWFHEEFDLSRPSSRACGP